MAALLVSGEKLRFPPVRLPLALYFAGTVISLLASQDPAAGRPLGESFQVDTGLQAGPADVTRKALARLAAERAAASESSSLN